jgi:hypothetical protein
LVPGARSCFSDKRRLSREGARQQGKDKSKENHESPGVSTYSSMIKERAHRVLIVKEIAFLFSEAHKSKGSNNLGYALVERFLDKIFLLATVARFAATTKRVFVHWYSLC